jgi:hypothetical protein
MPGERDSARPGTQGQGLRPFPFDPGSRIFSFAEFRDDK